MNKVIALVFLTLFIITLVPGLKIIKLTHTSTTTYDIVTIILNESKPIHSFYYVSPKSLSFYAVTITHSVNDLIPNDTVLFFSSGYPFMLNGHYAVQASINCYIQDILVTHNMIVYIDFVQSVPKNATLIYPITLTANATAPSVIVEKVNNNSGLQIPPSLFLILLVIVVVIVILAGRKIKR